MICESSTIKMSTMILFGSILLLCLSGSAWSSPVNGGRSLLSTSSSSPYGTSSSSDDDVLVPVDGPTLKSILLYNRLNQLVQNEPDMLELFDIDRSHLARIIDELLSQSNRSKKFLQAKSSKRAAAMGVDLPDYILHINKGRNFDFSSFREKMQKSG